jgi:cytoskeleton protein RodZ
MPKSTFGERLRREREMRGVGLEEISAATRISTRNLEALENEQWDRLPGGIFNRGFIRAVAHYLGLDEESILAEYSAATNDKPQVATWATETVPSPPRARPALVVALLLALAAGGWFAYREFAPYAAAWRTPAPPAPSPAPPSPPVVAAQTAEPSAGAPPEAGGAAAESAVLQLKVDVGKATRITVVADGQRIFEGTLEAGQQRRFEARRQFEISAADSGAVLLEMNGQTMPPLGTPGTPGQIKLTHRDLNRARGGQD